MKVAEIRARIRTIDDAIDALYWTYTRTARGKPPVVVRPDLYAERKQLAAELAKRTRRRKRCSKS